MKARRLFSALPVNFKRMDRAAKLARCPSWQRWASLVLMSAAGAELDALELSKAGRPKEVTRQLRARGWTLREINELERDERRRQGLPRKAAK